MGKKIEKVRLHRGCDSTRSNRQLSVVFIAKGTEGLFPDLYKAAGRDRRAKGAFPLVSFVPSSLASSDAERSASVDGRRRDATRNT